MQDTTLYRAWAEIDLSAVKENFAAARRLLPPAEKLLAVIKANGYGHGALPAAKALLSLPEGTRPDFFAVATAEEGLALREGGIETPILVLGHILPELYESAVRAELRLPVDSVEEAAAIGEAALKTGKKALLHVAVDSGMTRIGFPAEPSSAEPIEAITRLPGVFVEGIFTHLATADATDENWPATLKFHGSACKKTTDSLDVKYVEEWGKFIGVATGNRMGPSSWLALYESNDGLTFTPVDAIKEGKSIRDKLLELKLLSESEIESLTNADVVRSTMADKDRHGTH